MKGAAGHGRNGDSSGSLSPDRKLDRPGLQRRSDQEDGIPSEILRAKLTKGGA